MNRDNSVREMQVNDLQEIIETFSFVWDTKQETVETWEKYLEEHKQGKRTVYVVEVAGKIVGYGSLLYVPEYLSFREKGIPEIHDVWIHINFRGKGLGKILIQYLESMALKRGYPQVGLGVGLYRDYGPAQILYAKLGYIPDGNGITYKFQPTVAGENYKLDDELILWLTKSFDP